MAAMDQPPLTPPDQEGNRYNELLPWTGEAGWGGLLSSYWLKKKFKGNEMKNSALLIVAACAWCFSATAAHAQTTTTTSINPVEKCADLEGAWTFTYTGGVSDTVTFTQICSKEKAVMPTPDCMPGPGGPRDAWLCVAHGTRASNGQTVQIRRISYDTSGDYVYYEATDEQIIAGAQDQPYDLIPIATFLNCSLQAGENHYGLKSGVKTNCVEPTTTTTVPTTTTTVAGPCPAQKVLGDDSQDVESLRAFRDGSLANSALGRKLAQIYYNNADGINAVLDRSPVLRRFAGKALRAAAQFVK